jgi:chromosome segregation ATPase
MGTVYESLKVKLQRSKNDPVALAGVKHTHALTLDEKVDELVHELVQRTSGLKASVKQREEEIRKETQQVLQSLSENVAMLEAKLKDTEETVRTKESVSQKMQEGLTSEIHALQNELNAEKKTLQSRDREITDLKSNAEVLVKQVTEFELAIKQATADAATEANRSEQLTETFNTKVAALEDQIRDTMEIVRGKEATITALEQKLAAQLQDFESQLKTKDNLLAGRDAEIKYLNSRLQMLTGKIQKLSSFLKQAEALAAVEAQNISTLASSEPLSEVEKKPGASPFNAKVPPVMSNEQTTAAQQTVWPDFFEFMSQELAKIIGPQASMIVRERIAALGESMDSFPKSRLPELLEILSKEIANESVRIGFRKWFVKHVHR